MIPREPATSLSEFRADAAGQPFRALVELYTVRHDAEGLGTEIEATLGAFGRGAARRAERLYNVWNLRGQLGDAPGTDCAEVIDRVVEDARRTLPAGVDEGDLLRCFRLVTLGLALTASLFPRARRRMGIRTAGELAPGAAPGEEG
jgi:hypothetical protein